MKSAVVRVSEVIDASILETDGPGLSQDYLSQFLWKTAQIPLDATPALIPFQTNSQW